jgi:lantibiotic modifying enzyme
MTEIGGFEGWGSLLYTLTHLAYLWDDQAVLYQAKGVVEIIAGLVAQDDQFDIGRGSAGAIVTLLALHRGVAYDKALDVAIACGDHLLTSAVQTEQGLRWIISSSSVKPKKDLLHGNVGIAWALLELAAASGNERYAVAAQQAFDYERAHHSFEGEQQPNVNASEQSSMLEFGLARLCALQHLNDPKLYEELQLVVKSVLTTGSGRTHALYHGELGNLDFLQLASQQLSNEPCRMATERIGAIVIEEIERDGWKCGGPKDVEIPSLMLGLAGIGYGMLRLAEPDYVPSVLVLAPPPQKNCV